MSTFDLLVSGPFAIDDSTEEGVVLIVPAIDRAGSIVGVATGTITFAELATVAALASGAHGVKVAIDVRKPGAAPSSGGTTGDANAAIPNKRIFNFGGRTWTVTVPTSTGGDPLGAWLVVLVVGAGLATTAAVAAYLIGLGKTADIAEARAQLLRMLDGLGPLAWLLTSDGSVIHANRAASAVLGRGTRTRSSAGRSGTCRSTAIAMPRSGVSARPSRGGARRRFPLRPDAPRRRRDAARLRPVDPAARPRGRSTGQLVASAVDITGRHESEQTQRLLMRELDHRMKNTLQVIQAVIRRTARAQASVEAFERSLLGRVGAMSRAHDLLAEEHWLGAEMKAVVTQEVSSFDAGGAISTSGPRLRLNPRAALSIALVIHELAPTRPNTAPCPRPRVGSR